MGESRDPDGGLSGTHPHGVARTPPGKNPSRQIHDLDPFLEGDGCSRATAERSPKLPVGLLGVSRAHPP